MDSLLETSGHQMLRGPLCSVSACLGAVLAQMAVPETRQGGGRVVGREDGIRSTATKLYDGHGIFYFKTNGRPCFKLAQFTSGPKLP